MTESQVQEFLQRMQAGLRVTEIMAQRTFKTGLGDSVAGMTAAWNSVEGDPMTLQEAKVAHYLLAMQVDVAAHEAALANGLISPQACSDFIRSLRSTYGKLIRLALHAPEESP